VIEVASPSTRRHDLVRKRRVYEQAGVAEYWFVDLDALRLERYHLDADGRYAKPAIIDDGVIRSAALPELEVPVAEVLAPAVLGRD
jgi:Uma2 family endonuclease